MDPISLNAVELQGPATSLAKKVETVTIKPTGDGANQQNAAAEANSYYKFDTMELSQEYVGYRMKSENATVGSDTNPENSTIRQQSDRVNGDDEKEQEEKHRSQSAKTEEDEETISNSQLGGYTSFELKSLVLAGKISVAAYNAEMKSRQEKDSATEATAPMVGIKVPQPQKVELGQFTRRKSNNIF